MLGFLDRAAVGAGEGEGEGRGGCRCGALLPRPLTSLTLR